MWAKSLIAGFVFGFTLFSSFGFEAGVQSSYAQGHQHHQYTAQLWATMGPGDREIVDRLAADFYERSLRYAQTQTIERQTAQLYAGATPANRASYLQQRRQQWQQMDGHQQQALRNTKRPLFVHLSEQQKWPFREHALNQLGASGAIQQATGPGYRPGI